MPSQRLAAYVPHRPAYSVGMTVKYLWAAKALLGETPVWQPVEQRLYWLDIKGRRLLSCDAGGGEQSSTPLAQEAAALVPRQRGGFVVGIRGALAACDPRTGAIVALMAIESDRNGNRFNDGKADSAGRLWIGSMHDAETAPDGALYRVSPDLTAMCADDGYVVTNGPAISPDGRTLYHTESPSRTIYAFDLTPDGMLARKRVFARFTVDEGYPDGMTCDADGRLWVAHWGGGRVTCRDWDGAARATIPLPTPFVTSCCFGGEGYETLFITTAVIGLAPETRAGDPLAGGLFAARPGVRGLPPDRFGG
jgi:xylono-1,5-lactonase